MSVERDLHLLYILTMNYDKHLFNLLVKNHSDLITFNLRIHFFTSLEPRLNWADSIGEMDLHPSWLKVVFLTSTTSRQRRQHLPHPNRKPRRKNPPPRHWFHKNYYLCPWSPTPQPCEEKWLPIIEPRTNSLHYPRESNYKNKRQKIIVRFFTICLWGLNNIIPTYF